MLRALLLALFLLLLPAAAQAQWVTTGFLSKHLTHNSTYARHHAYRETNAGIGYETEDWSLGAFENSTSRTSAYVFHKGFLFALGDSGFKAGAVTGAFIGGYDSSVVPAPLLPTLSWEGKRLGFNVVFVPQVRNFDVDAAIALQLKVRVF